MSILSKIHGFHFLVLTLLMPGYFCTSGAELPISECSYNYSSIPKIDGKLNDSCYKNIKGLELYDNVTGQAYEPSSIIKIFTDGKKLYIAGKLMDPEISKSKRKTKKRDDLDWAQTFEIFIAPAENDSYYQIAIDPWNNLFDNIAKSRAMDHDFDIDHATSINPEGWTFEVALPLNQLGFPERVKKGDEIALNLCRTAGNASPKNSAWSPTGGVFHRRQCFGSLVVGSYSDASELQLLKLSRNEKNFSADDIAKYKLLKKRTSVIRTTKEYLEFLKDLKDLKTSIFLGKFKGEKLVTFACNPWRVPKTDELPEPKQNESIYKLKAVQDEYITFALGVANITKEPVRLRCVPSPVLNQNNLGYIKFREIAEVRRVAKVAVRGGGTQRDPLTPLDIETIFDSRALSNDILFLTINTQKLKPGKYNFALDLVPLVKRSYRCKVYFQLEVYPVKLPEMPLPYSHTWARYNWPPTKDTLEACYQDQKDHYINMQQTDPLGQEQALAGLKLAVDGKLLNLPDFSLLEKKIDTFGTNTIYLFGANYGNFEKYFIKNKYGRENFKKYLDTLYNMLKSKGIDKDHFVWYIEDEPSEERAKKAAEVARLFLELKPEWFSTFVTFYSKTSLKTIEILAPYITLWCPALNARQDQLDIVRKRGRKDAKLMSYGVYGRVHSQYAAYRLSALRALQKGYIGVGFWNYCDAGDSLFSSTWDDFDGVTGVSDYSVIYEGSRKPVSSIRWEAWREGLQDYKFILFLKKLCAATPAGKLKNAGLKLAKDAVDEVIHNNDFTAADRYRQKIREMLVRLSGKGNILQGENPILYCLTGNSRACPNIESNGQYTTGGPKFQFNAKGSTLTDGNLRWNQGYMSFGANVLYITLKDKYKVQGVVFNASNKFNYEILALATDANGNKWNKFKVNSKTKGIRGEWYRVKLNNILCNLLRLSISGDKGRKNIGELYIYGYKLK